ncbi:uncharacterized protein LOC126277361 [Schistocerca gregaria]|uniref:uncharacterized protein LOC126277361 n=1 Tax=Schistocerca gregaria TaxID=7010 RepID=UPI00211EDD2A|nr:uncharacterized protein LOC126277361 [Schistocerca gregaria]
MHAVSKEQDWTVCTQSSWRISPSNKEFHPRSFGHCGLSITFGRLQVFVDISGPVYKMVRGFSTIEHFSKNGSSSIFGFLDLPQFESTLFQQPAILCGFRHHHTTAYHPVRNGIVERWHRTLKTALMFHNDSCTSTLPVVLPSLRTACKSELRATMAELVYGENLRLLAEFFVEMMEATVGDMPYALQQVRNHMAQLQRKPGSRHGTNTPFVHKQISLTKKIKTPVKNCHLHNMTKMCSPQRATRPARSRKPH